MKLYDGYITIGNKAILTPGPVSVMELAFLRFGPILAAAAVGAQVYGKIQEGQAADVEGKSQQNMANYNAALQEREARTIEQKTRLEQIQQAKEAERRAGTLRAKLGASGAVTTSGSPLLIQTTQAEESELENLRIGEQGAEQALASRQQGQLDLLSGRLARQRGKAARTGAFIGAGSTLLTGYSDISSKY